MPRKLVYVPPTRPVLTEHVPVGHDYAKGWTADEMRGWAEDWALACRTIESDRGLPPDQQRLPAWRAAPREQLTREQRGAVQVYDRLHDPHDGITGDLRPDGRVELDHGRHRAHYILARGSEPVPVWVSSPDEARLDAFRADCHDEARRLAREQRTRTDHRGGREAATRELGRIALGGAADERAPDVHFTKERVERTRDRDAFRPEWGER